MSKIILRQIYDVSCMCTCINKVDHLLAEANGRSAHVIKLTFCLNMHMYIGGAEMTFGRPSCSVRQNSLYTENSHNTLRSIYWLIIRFREKSVHVVCTVNSDVANCLTFSLTLRKRRTLPLSLRSCCFIFPNDTSIPLHFL